MTQTQAQDEEGLLEQDYEDDNDGGLTDDEETVEESKGKERQKRKRKEKKSEGNNAEAHALLKRCMPFWIGTELGPNMGDAPFFNQRMQLAAKAIRAYKVTALQKRADAIENNQDVAICKSLKDAGNQADKVLTTTK